MKFQLPPLVILSMGVWEKQDSGHAASQLREMQASGCIRGYSVVPGDQILGVVESAPLPIVVVIKDTAYSAQLAERIVALKRDLAGIDVIRVRYSVEATQASSLSGRNAEHFVDPAELWDTVARTVAKHLPTAREESSEDTETPPTRPQTSEGIQSAQPQSDDEKTKAAPLPEPNGVSEEKEVGISLGGWLARLREARERANKKPPSEPSSEHSLPVSTAEDNRTSHSKTSHVILIYETIYVAATKEEIEATQKALGELSRFLKIVEVATSAVTSNLALRPAVVVIGLRNALDASGIVDDALTRVLICDERGINKYIASLPEAKVVHPKNVPAEIASAIRSLLALS